MLVERGLLDLPFLVLVVLAYIDGPHFPDITVTVIRAFNEVVADSGIVRDDGSFSALALFGNNLRAMVLSTLYGFIPFLYLPALSMGVNAILLGMVASSVNGQWLLLAAGILPHGIFELPALVLFCAAGLYLCSRVTARVRGDKEVRILRTLSEVSTLFLYVILRVTGLVVIPLLVVAAIMESYVTPAVMQLFV